MKKAGDFVENNESLSLLIPVKLKAALVGRKAPRDMYSGFSYDFSDLGNPYAAIEKPLFSVSGRLPGVYLHWELPDCFSHGSQDEATNEIAYRLAPNRWAVTRLWQENGTMEVKSKTFFLDSDVLSKEADASNYGSPTWPFPEDQAQPYRYLGRFFTESDWDKRKESDGFIRLTAVSPLSPFFAAYAPMCQNVFSFYDNLPEENIQYATLSYVVCGWYEKREEAEPFSQITTLSQLEHDFSLTFDGTDWPERTFCHGMLSNIFWETANTWYHSGIPDDPEPGEIVTLPSFAIGNNAAEASAALSHSHASDGGERLLQYYLQHMEADLDRRQGIAKAEADLQKTKFSVEHHVGITGLRLTANGQTPGGNTDTPPPSTEFMKRLSRLRQQERMLDRERENLLQNQRAAYENWYLHLYSDPPYDTAYMNATLLTLQNSAFRLSQLKKMENDIKQELATMNPGKGYEFFEEPEEHFFTPTEPVLLVSQLTHQNQENDHTLLFTRLENRTVTKIILPDLAGNKLELSANVLFPTFSLPKSLPLKIQIVLRRVISECLLLSNSFAQLLAKAAFLKVGITPSAGDLKRLALVIEAAQNSNSQKSDFFDGLLPETFSRESYHPLWSPLILEWELLYYPDPELLDTIPKLTHWKFSGGDYTYKGGRNPDPILKPDNAYPISGRILISGNAEMQMDSLLHRYFADRCDVKKSARTVTRFSQALNGFNNALLMRERMLSPALFTQNEEDARLIAILASQDNSVLSDKPLFDTLFSPVRAGFLSLVRLRIIDSLGHFQNIHFPDVYAGEGLRTKEAVNPVQNIMLPPRLVQAARLQAHFLNSEPGCKNEEAFFTSTSSPVCGFILPNKLDHSIVVYSRNGIPAGSLNLIQMGTGVRWASPPGYPSSTKIPEDLDSDMYAFLCGLKDAGPIAIQNLVEYISDLQYHCQSSSHTLSEIEFIGKPVALFRMEAGIELFGNPECYRHNMDGGVPDKTAGTDISAMEIPVRIGELQNSEDGVIGFFQNEDYSRIQVYDDVPLRKPDPYFIPNHTVTLSPMNAASEKPSEKKVLTLLADPWSGINLISGILPVRTLRLPKELMTDILEKVAVTFFSSPVLINGEKAVIPVPHSDNLDFYWLSQAEPGKWNRALLSHSDDYSAAHILASTASDGYVQIYKKEKEEVSLA